MEENLTIPEGMDAGAVNLARSIRKQESGGDYNKYGDSDSSYGAYQWNNQPNGKSVPLKKGEIPSNFKSFAQEVKLDPNDFSPKNQDMVAYKKIKALKDSGKNVIQIAAIWNGGDENRYDPNYVTKSGLPSQKKGVYDVPGYAKAVNDYYQNLKNKTGSSSPDSSTNSDVLNAKDPFQDTPPPASPTYTTDPHSPERLAQYKAEDKALKDKSDQLNSAGGIIGNTVKGFGDKFTLGGASALGEQLGTGYAKNIEQVKGLFGGQDNSKYIPDMDWGKTTAGLVGTVGGVLASAAPGLKGLFKGEGALANPKIQQIIKLGSGNSTVNRQGVFKILKDTLKDIPLKDIGGKDEKLILKALEELKPTLIEKRSIMSKLGGAAKGLLKGAGWSAVGAAVGPRVASTVKGIID